MKVLIADDDVEMLALLEVLFEEIGHQTVLVPNGADALDELGDAAEFDLVLTDLRMPGIDGLKVLQEITARQLNVPCAVMSAHTDMDLLIRSLRLNAIDFIPKPVTELALRELIERVAAMHAPAPPSTRTLAVNPLYEIYQVEMPSNRQWVSELCHRVVGHYLTDQPRDVQDTIRLALHESLVNAIVHGNFGISSAAREDGRFDEYEAEIDAGEKDPVLSQRPVLVKVRRQPERLRIMVKDVGEGFDHRNLPAPDSEAALNFSGRGITLIRHCMDEVSWNESGTQIDMLKQLGNGAALV